MTLRVPNFSGHELSGEGVPVAALSLGDFQVRKSAAGVRAPVAVVRIDDARDDSGDDVMGLNRPGTVSPAVGAV